MRRLSISRFAVDVGFWPTASDIAAQANVSGQDGRSAHEWGLLASQSQIILKTDERSAVLELGRDGKLAAKSSGWGENLRFSKTGTRPSPSGGLFRSVSRGAIYQLKLPLRQLAVEPVRHYSDFE
jgi:hypothetical protein